MVTSKRLHALTYMATGGLLALAIQVAGGFTGPGSPRLALAAPSIATAAHSPAAARLRAGLLAAAQGPIGGTQGIKIFQFGLVHSSHTRSGGAPTIQV